MTPREQRVSIPLDGGGAMRGFLALPEGSPPPRGWPLVLAIHDILGFSRDIHRIVRRFAENGFATLAPALFDGAGPPLVCVVRTFRDLNRRDGPAFQRIEAARTFATAREDIDGERVGVTGFCLGGGFAIFYAARGGLRVCAPYYGEMPDTTRELQRVCPVVAGFGALDRPFAGQGEKLERLLTELGVDHDVKVYPEVGHAYMNDHGKGALTSLGRHTPMHAAYDENAAEDSWRRMLDFFGKHL